MILIRLQLENFRQYHRLDLSFQDGITGIVGRNGAGKSTILEAVLWCLFGNRAARTDKEGIKRQGAAIGDPCNVTLDFELKNATYCLTRSLIGKNNRSEARLEKRGRLDAISTREVDDFVIRLIGLDLRGFLSSFFARQRELNALTDTRPAERKEHLARMLGVGRLDGAIQLLKDDLKTTRQKIDLLSALQIDPEDVKSQLASKQSEIVAIGLEIEPKQQEVTALAELIVLQDKEIADLRKKEEKAVEIENQISSLMAHREGAEKQIDRLMSELAELVKVAGDLPVLKTEMEQIESVRLQLDEIRRNELLARERKRLDEELAVVQAGIRGKGEENSRHENRILQLDKELADGKNLTEQLAALEGKRETIATEYREIKSDLRVAETDLAKLTKQKHDIAKLGPEAVCEFCLRPFGQEFSEIEKHFDQEIISLEKRIEPLRKRLADREGDGLKIKEALNTLRSRTDKINKLEQERAAALASLTAGKTALADSENRQKAIIGRLTEIGDVAFDPEKAQALEHDLDRREKAKAAYHRLTERLSRRPEVEVSLQSAREALAELDRQIGETLAQKQALGFDKNAYQQALDAVAVNRDKAEQGRLILERLAGNLRLIESEVAGLTKKLAEYEKAKEEIGRLRDLLTYLEKISLLFGEFRQYLIGRIRPSLSRQTSRLFYEMTGGRYQEVALDEDYNLRLYDHGEDFPIDRFSGGEIDLANLCLRLAIAIEMASGAGIDYSFIILDEIFGSQDSDRQRLIFEGLARLKNRFRQIIIISHIDDVKEMAEHIISVGVDPDGVSVATSIEGL